MDRHCLCDHGQSPRTLLPSLIDIFHFFPEGLLQDLYPQHIVRQHPF